ncbi:MAG TPA: ABC transporter substrate-binding protein [Gaiellaceae bacterium]|nr:ABC transporter substrate-binding protein [Gaiellaceae bacterium]
MSRLSRRWKLILPLGVLVIAASVAVSTSLAASGASAGEIRVAIMTDCKGAFGFGYEIDIGGAQAALAQYAGGKVKNPKKPSAGMTGIKAGGKDVRIVGYGCGDDTVPTAVKETRRLMEQLRADVMIGPLSGDEAVYVARYAKSHPTKTFIIGTAGSQDPTLQLAQPNVFRYHGDGAQWNAGTGEIAYKRLGWRNAAIIMDDYSFGWTSAAGLIADFCAIGGKITKRVYPPLNTTDYSSYVQQLPSPDSVDGYFWVVGGTGTAASLKAFEQSYGALKPSQHIGNLFFAFLGADKVVAPKVVGSYVGGFGTGPGLKTRQAKAYEAVVAKHYPGLNGGNYADGFVYNYYNAAWALVQGLTKSGGRLGPALNNALPRTLKPGYQVTNNGVLRLDRNRQAIQDQYPLQVVKNGNTIGTAVVGYVPNVDQSFGGLFKKTSPPPGRTQPPCVKKKTPWQGKIKVVKNGVITNQTLK